MSTPSFLLKNDDEIRTRPHSSNTSPSIKIVGTGEIGKNAIAQISKIISFVDVSNIEAHLAKKEKSPSTLNKDEKYLFESDII